MRVGFAGLGLMGAPIARNWIRAGFEVSVWNRTPAKLAPLVEAGATPAADLVELGRSSEIVGLSLPKGDDVRELLAERGLLDALPEGGIVLDHSTIAPADARALAGLCRERGRHYLDAPVSGGPPGAAAATLCVMVGGDAGVLERARGVINATAAKVVHVGGPGLGQVAKLANNLCVMLTYVGTQEAFELAMRSGVDPAVLLEVMRAATAHSHTLDARPPVEGIVAKAPASNGWAPGFTTDMMAKDIDLALEAAAQVELALEGTRLGHSLLREAQGAGLGGEDFSAYAKLRRPSETPG